MTSFSGRTVLITGAASGIGRLMALGAAQRGAILVLWDLRAEPLELVAKEIENEGGTAYAYTCDVGDRAAVGLTADEVHREGLCVDVLVNNAGMVVGRRLLDLTDEDIERTFRVNALAHYWTTRAFLPRMIERGSGHVVTIASAGGLAGSPRLTAYNASKAAVIGFTDSLRLELDQVAPKIRTTTVCPFAIDTGMFEGVRVRLPRLTPILHQEDVAEAILDAVEKNRERLYMPWLTYPFAALRALPAAVSDAIQKVMGLADTMDQFVGREGSKEPEVPAQGTESTRRRVRVEREGDG